MVFRFGLLLTKVAVFSLFLYKTQDLSKIIIVDNLDAFLKFEQNDFNHLISFILAMSVLEIIIYIAIHRWKQHIKRDIFRAFSHDIK